MASSVKCAAAARARAEAHGRRARQRRAERQTLRRGERSGRRGQAPAVRYVSTWAVRAAAARAEAGGAGAEDVFSSAGDRRSARAAYPCRGDRGCDARHEGLIPLPNNGFSSEYQFQQYRVFNVFNSRTFCATFQFLGIDSSVARARTGGGRGASGERARRGRADSCVSLASEV